MKISIITVSFNSEKTLKDTINSVLSQTYKNIEYIIIDGESSDGTMAIVSEYEKLFQGRMKWKSEKDHGLYDAMNKGIAMSTGDIIGILNSDDYFTSNDVIERMVSAFEDDIDAVYGDVHFVHQGVPDRCVRYYSSALFKPSLLRYGFMPAHPSFYARRRIYERYGYYSLNYNIASDYDLMVRLLYKYKIKSRYLKMDFVTMRIGGISTKNINNRLLITQEDVLACRRNGLYSNIFLISFKYFVKIFEFKFY